MSLHVYIYASQLLAQNPEQPPTPASLTVSQNLQIIPVFQFGALCEAIIVTLLLCNLPISWSVSVIVLGY
jgi:hypothetical protein